MKNSLINRIKKYLAAQGREMELTELYASFPDHKPTTIRGRINENVGNGIARVAKGLYISQDVLVEHANILERLDDMKQSGMKYDFIFLDIPYSSPGQRGGNRRIAKFDTITVDEFQKLTDGLKDLLTESGTVQFMITSGTSSSKTVQKYIDCFDKSGLLELKRGEYVKMNGNGSRCNIGKYLLPPELVIIYGAKDMDVSEWSLDFHEVRQLGYPTQKPVSLMKKLIDQATRIGDWVLDPFGGSGATLKACLELKRKCHIMDISENSVYKYILPILK
jgi:hypothetical protein